MKSRERRVIHIEERLRERMTVGSDPSTMTRTQVAEEMYRSLKLFILAGRPPDRIPADLVEQYDLHFNTWDEFYRRWEIYFFESEKSGCSFDREYSAAIREICAKLRAMGVQEPTEAELADAVKSPKESGPPPEDRGQAETGPTPDAAPDPAKEEILSAAPQEPVKAPNETETPTANMPEPEPFPFPGYGALRPAGEVSQTLRDLIMELRSK